MIVLYPQNFTATLPIIQHNHIPTVMFVYKELNTIVITGVALSIGIEAR